MVAYQYDVIVVGARCAGSPTAMLLARRGYRVLLVDRAAFPSDTISTHVVQPTGIAALNRWGLLDQLLSTGCPPVGTYTFDLGHGNQEAMDGFARTNAGVTSPADFFSDENTGRVFAASRAVAVP